MLSRVVQRLDEETARRRFKPSVFATVHSLHGFFNGREVSEEKPLFKAHKFVAPHFDYHGDPENAARFMDRRLDALAEAEAACGLRFVVVTRADNRTQLFTGYEGAPLLDAAEWAYLQARNSPVYAKNPAAAVTDELLDRALARLPKVERSREEAPPEPADDEDDEPRERWESADLMGSAVLKGRWTKWENSALSILEAEFDAGADPELVAAREAAKIIEFGKAVKKKLARERLRFAMRPAGPDDDDDTAGEHSGNKTVFPQTDVPAEPTLDKNVVVPLNEIVEAQQLENSGVAEPENPALAHALEFARAGIGVLALWGVADGICDCPDGSECRSAGKHPHSTLARRGVYSAATDEKVIRSWFGRDPRINVGLAMGGALNLIAVDIDPRNDGDATYSDLVDAHGEDAFPETFTVRTGGGGWHKLYRLPEAIKPAKGELKGKLGPGIDVKGEGGVVVAPSSLHSSGRRYEVEVNAYIAEAPEWIVNSLRKSAEGLAPERVINFQAHCDRKQAGGAGATIVEGERNERLFRVGCALWGKGEVAGAAELLRRLIETNFERVSPPLEATEVQKIAESISRRYPLGVPIREGAA
jgi:hypothetical protein